MADYGIDMQSGRVWWLYQARRVNSQTNAGGGALTTRISVPAGTVARVMSYYAAGPASNTTLTINIGDEDGALNARAANIPAGVSRDTNIPSIGTAASANSNIIDSRYLMLGPGETINAAAAAALNTETLTVGVVMLLSTATEPTWDTTGSAGTPSLAASTISAANTLQAVVL